MTTKNLTPRELDYLRRVYLKAEIEIINEIARLRARGLVDYHAVAALERVQAILLSMQDATWKYAPRMIQRYFYVNHPEAYTRAPKTLQDHLRGYESAAGLTATEQDIVQRLTFSLIGDLERSSANILANLSEVLLGRNRADLIRRAGLEAVIRQQATGGMLDVNPQFVEELRQAGLTAFVDKAGRHWSLHDYADMVLRSTAREASVLSVITKDPEQDLYYIPKLGSTCKICAPLEGRVYSLSGKDPVFPPLAMAYGKVNKDGPDSLDNSYLNIHPNCMHPLVPYVLPDDPEERRRIERFSDPRTNPFDRDPRSEKQIKAYKDNQAARAKWNRMFDQYLDMRTAIPNVVPKTFQTFQKHKLLNDDKYKAWVKAYKEFERT